MNHNFFLKYNNIELRPLSLNDSERLRKIRNRDNIRMRFVSKNIITAEEQRLWYQNYCSSVSEIMFSIYVDATFIGGNAIYNIDNKRDEAEYGRLIIDDGFWGNGYGYQATMAAKKIARDELKMKKLYLNVYKDNIFAIDSYYKCGFQSASVIKLYDESELVKMEVNF